MLLEHLLCGSIIGLEIELSQVSQNLIRKRSR